MTWFKPFEDLRQFPKKMTIYETQLFGRLYRWSPSGLRTSGSSTDRTCISITRSNTRFNTTNLATEIVQTTFALDQRLFADPGLGSFG